MEVVVVLMAGVCVLDEVWKRRGEGRCRGSRREGKGEQRGMGGGGEQGSDQNHNMHFLAFKTVQQ